MQIGAFDVQTTNEFISLAQTGEEVSENSKRDDKEQESKDNLQLCKGWIVRGPCKVDVLDAV